MKFLALSIALLLFSCNPQAEEKGSTIDEIRQELENPSGPEGPETPTVNEFVTEEMIATAEATPLMVEKAAAYREASKWDTYRNGIYVYSGGTFDSYVSKPEKLAARIAMLGFRDVHLSPGSSRIKNASDALKRFIAACSKYGIAVYAVSLESLQNLVSVSNAQNEVQNVITYNGKVAQGQKFAGISADLEPHTCHDSKKPSGIAYTWDSSTNYGKGKDNDQLLRICLETLSSAANKAHEAGLSFCEAIFYNYQIYYNQGQLEYGSTPQFLQSCDFLVTMAYRTDKESIWSKSEPGIKAAGKEKSVSVCVKTRINSDSGDSIQQYGWNNLLDVARYVNTKAASYTAYRGFDMFTFDGIETMWEWTNDKN